MDKTKIIVGDFMVKRIDSMNWQIFERRKLNRSQNPNNKSREGEIDWVALPAFYGTLKPALVRMKELHRDRGIVRGDLKAAIAAIEKADADFIAMVDKTLAEKDVTK